jgi:hypothetical protein
MKRQFLTQLATAVWITFSPLKATDSEPESSRSNNVFIMADQWRKQTLDIMNEDKGANDIKTPQIERLAAS